MRWSMGCFVLPDRRAEDAREVARGKKKKKKKKGHPSHVKRLAKNTSIHTWMGLDGPFQLDNNN